MTQKNTLTDLTRLIRRDIVEMTTAAGTGHPSSSLSAVELLTALWFDGYFHHDFSDPKAITNDKIIFSKGHACPLLYALYHAAGVLSHEELLTLRQFDSVLEGHPTPRFEHIDVATGSLGQGLSIGLGMALGVRLQMSQASQSDRSSDAQQKTNLKANSYQLTANRLPHIFVVLGDSEMAEGQVWEAAQLAAHYKTNNLVAILDVNRLGQRGETMIGWDLKTYEDRIKAFGWNTIIIEEGNDLESVRKEFKKLNHTLTPDTQNLKPTIIIAKTQKGAGVSSIADKDGWHGKPLTKEMTDAALKEIGDVDPALRGEVTKPTLPHLPPTSSAGRPNSQQLKAISYHLEPNIKVATREAYGEGIALLAEDSTVVALDAETSNSTYAEKMKKADEKRFFEMFIAEQNMVSVALGMSKVGLKAFSSSFAAFLTRAFDQIRMAQYADGNVKIVGSHAGVSIGPDGSSQMALEDIAMMRSILHSIVLYPSDAVSTVHLMDEMRKHEGISYLRLTREKTPVLYAAQEQFPIGGSKVLKSSNEDKAIIIGAGITLHESLKAHAHLLEKGVRTAVIDAYSIKPLDAKTITQYAGRTGHVVVVEDHYPEGGLGEAVRYALEGMDVKFTHLCVRKIPRSGTPEELMQYEEIDAAAIVKVLNF